MQYLSCPPSVHPIPTPTPHGLLYGCHCVCPYVIHPVPYTLFFVVSVFEGLPVTQPGTHHIEEAGRQTSPQGSSYLCLPAAGVASLLFHAQDFKNVGFGLKFRSQCLQCKPFTDSYLPSSELLIMEPFLLHRRKVRKPN